MPVCCKAETVNEGDLSSRWMKELVLINPLTLQDGPLEEGAGEAGRRYPAHRFAALEGRWPQLPPFE